MIVLYCMQTINPFQLFIFTREKLQVDQPPRIHNAKDRLIIYTTEVFPLMEIENNSSRA